VKPAIIPLAPVTIIAIINYILSLLVLSVRAQDNSNTTHLIKNSIENNTIHIEGKFKYCDVKTNEIIDLYEPCRNRYESKAKFPELIQYHMNNESKSSKKMYHILSKEKNTIYGMAYECKLVELKVILKKSFFGYKYPPIKTYNPIEINREFCLNMIKTRTCDGKKMHCDQFNCYSIDPDYSNQYTYIGDAIWSDKKCSFVNRQITGHDLNNSLFSVQSSLCKANDGFCLMSESIIVWHPEEVIHKCPFMIIASLNLEHLDDDMLYSQQDALAFQVISKSEECQAKFNIYSSNEGLYLILVNKSQKYTELSKNNFTHAINKNLLLNSTDENLSRNKSAQLL